MSISHSLVAQIAQEVECVFTDFAFLPPPKDVEIMTTSKIPLWTGTTTKEPPCAFDVVGISNSVMIELLNLPKLLHFSDIPLFKNERMMHADIPLIVLGGANAANTSLLHGPVKEQGFENNYGLVDAVLIGEGEYSVRQFLQVVKKGKASGLTKADILRECHGKVDGFYEPDKYEHRYKAVTQNPPGKTMNLVSEKNVLAEIKPKEPYVAFPVKSAVVYDLHQVRTLESGPLWYETETLGTGSLQISNGCPCFCSFCAESWERKPYRERSLSNLAEGLKAAKARQGLDTINLLSFNFNTHAELYPLILSFYKEMANVSLKSQRFDLLSTDRFLAEVQQMIGKSTVSCGMEGISERLRRYLHKNLTEDQIYKACEFLLERGIRELKIFLIATGLEQTEDFEEFGKFVKRLEDLKKMSDSHVRIIFSLTPLYCPPHTPLQFHACTTATEDKRSIRKEIERTCKINRMEFRESASHEEIWLTQLLAMGDRRLTPALIRSSITDEFLYYNNVPRQVVAKWQTYLQELGLSEKDCFCEKGNGHVFPWDDIDLGISKKFLWEEYERSIRFAEREYCMGRPYIEAKCLGCGACPSGSHIKTLTEHQPSQPFLMEELSKITKSKQNLITLRIIVEINKTMRLVHKKFIGVAIARALMLSIPELVPYYNSMSGHLRDFKEDTATADVTYGINVYYLTFLLKDRIKELLCSEALSQKLTTIQKHCSGFSIREFTLCPVDTLDVKYILYNMHFPKNFEVPFIELKMGEFLHNNYVKHTLLKRDGYTIFNVDKKGKKNAVVLYARINNRKQNEKTEEEPSIVMAVTNRFDIPSFLKTFYGFEKKRETVCTKIESLGYYGKSTALQKDTRCISCNDYINETLLAGQPPGKQQCLVCSIDTKPTDFS
ncbi:MAG TPA: radical SAM protein [Chitinophagaceae bacterium]|nr:radical SAM protein [Chitinophagaceae bacterium]